MADGDGSGLACRQHGADQISKDCGLLDRRAHPRTGDKCNELRIVDAAADVFIRQDLTPALAAETARRIGALPKVQREIDAFEEALVIRVEHDARAELQEEGAAGSP